MKKVWLGAPVMRLLIVAAIILMDKLSIGESLGINMKVVQDLRILFFEMYSERFDLAPPPSRENSARFPSNSTV